MNLDLRTLAPLVCLLVDLGALISLSDSDEAAAAAAAAAAASATASAAFAAAAAKAACFDNSEKIMKFLRSWNWKGLQKFCEIAQI